MPLADLVVPGLRARRAPPRTPFRRMQNRQRSPSIVRKPACPPTDPPRPISPYDVARRASTNLVLTAHGPRCRMTSDIATALHSTDEIDNTRWPRRPATMPGAMRDRRRARPGIRRRPHRRGCRRILATGTARPDDRLATELGNSAAYGSRIRFVVRFNNMSLENAAPCPANTLQRSTTTGHFADIAEPSIGTASANAVTTAGGSLPRPPDLRRDRAQRAGKFSCVEVRMTAACATSARWARFVPALQIGAANGMAKR